MDIKQVPHVVIETNGTKVVKEVEQVKENNMEYVISGKRCGKTAQMIKMSAKKQMPILVKDNQRKDMLLKQAKEMNVDNMPEPVTYEDLKKRGGRTIIKVGEKLLRLQAENQRLSQKLNAIKELSDKYENELSMVTASYYMERIREIIESEG